MRFIVSKTTGGDEKPCKEAIKLIDSKNGDWCVDINTLEELIVFIQKYGDIVMTTSLYSENEFEIEIYDTWRE